MKRLNSAGVVRGGPWSAIIGVFLISASAFGQVAITGAPTNESVPINGTATFSVTANDGANNRTLSYAWTYNGNAHPVLSTSNVLTLPGVVDSSAGTYTVKVSDTLGSTASASAVLAVTHPPVIEDQPQTVIVTNGGDAFFEVGAESEIGGLAYQWYSNGVAISGATTNTLEFNPANDSEAASYSAVITNSDGAVTSSVALLTVVDAIATSPSSALPLNTCTNVTFSVTTHGTDLPLTFQWYDNLGHPVGANSSTYSISDIQESAAGTYSLMVSDAGGNSATAIVTISVTNPPPVVLTTNLTIFLDATGHASITPAQVNNGSYDKCAIASMGVSPSNFDCANVGTNIVILSVTDSSNLTSTASALVTVLDTNLPTLRVSPITVQLDPTGNYTLTAADVANLTAGTTDPCMLASTNVTPNTFAYCDAPGKSVTVVVTDIYGNVSSNSTTVSITRPAGPPPVAYVDPNYIAGSPCPSVTFPYTGGSGAYYVGYNAFPTIQQGLNAVTNGGTVLVAPGTYNESPQLNQSVRLESIGGNSASNTIIILPGNPPTTYVSALAISASEVRVKGFTVVGYDSDGEYTPPTYGQASVNILLNPAVSNIEIANNLIEVGAISTNENIYTGSDGFGIETTYNVPNGGENFNFHNNVFQPVDAAPAYDIPGNAFFINPANNFRFVSNTITGGLEQSTTSASNSLIAYNTVIGISTNDYSGAFATWGYPDPSVYGRNVTFLDNSITNVASGIAIYDSEDITVQNNQLAGNGVGVSIQDSGYIPVYAGGNTVHILDNDFSDDSLGVSDTSSNSTPIVTSNWWGDVSGPYNATLNPYGVGAPASTNITITPWLGSGINTEPALLGFYPNPTPVEFPPVQLVFTTEPGGANLGSLLTVQPIVQIEDTNGHTTPWANPTVSLILTNDLTGAVLAGDTNELAVGGIATYTSLSVITSGGSNLNLVAMAPYLSPTLSAQFNITNPLPGISTINPFFVRAGAGNVMLVVTGSNFVADSVVYWNGVALATTFVSSTELTAIIPANDVSSVGTAPITVDNPGPGGGFTGSLTFDVDITIPPVT